MAFIHLGEFRVRKSVYFAAVAMAVAGTSIMGSPGAGIAAGGSGNVLDLPLSEPYGASKARDLSGMGHDGTIGSHVAMNGDYGLWDRHSPGEGIDYGVDHLIVVPDAVDGSLDPEAEPFSIQFEYRTKESFGNILQKGQANTSGGQVKFQLPRGKIQCMFKTPQGKATAGSGTRTFNDNLWHTVRCDRTTSSVTLYVDGVRVGRSSNTTGTLNNKKPWVLGGKIDCDAINVTCDYFAGGIQNLRITKGYLPAR